MTRPSATPDLPPGSAAGVLAIDIAAAAAGQQYPEWIKVAPRGPTVCRDARRFTFDPEALVSSFNEHRVDLPIDLDHATVHKAPKGEAAPAHGWVKELQARSDGIYGRTEWLPGGKAILDAKTHRYVSPAFPFDGAGNATWLHSVALVAAPALSNMPALASAQHQHQEPSMKGIATAVGLQEGASETAILSAISAGFVKKEVHDETLAKLSASTTELATLKADLRKGEIDRALEEALKAKKIVPAEREHYAKLCATDDGFTTVKGLLGAMTPKIGGSGLDTRQAETGGGAEKDAATLAADATKMSKDRGISFTDAMSIVSRQTAA